MKKGIIITLGVVLSVLLIFIGVNNLKTNKTPTTQSNKYSDSFSEAQSKAALTEQREKERMEIKDIGKSKYQSVVILQDDLNTKINYGTGFIISKNKILTNEHVSRTFKNNEAIARLRNENGEFVDFKVVNVTKAPNGADLSIVEVAPNDNGQNIGDNINLLEFATQEEINNVKVDDMFHTVGYPIDKPYSTLWFTEGKLLYLDNGITLHDALIAGGCSGSPLLNKDGKIIGLNNAGGELEGQGKYVSYGFLLNKDLYEFIMNNI